MENEGWQDRLPPVLGAMCNVPVPGKHGRRPPDLAHINKRSRVDRTQLRISVIVSDQIDDANIGNCDRDRRNGSPSAAAVIG